MATTSIVLFVLAACGDGDAFYDDPVPGLAALPLGAIARFERIGHTSPTTIGLKAGLKTRHGADVYRVLYRTVGLDGEPDVASARLAIPDDLLPDQPVAVVAHLHGTVGLADRCAPSRDGGFGFESSSNPNAARMVALGHVVVEPDYLGLGPPGPHPYTVARPTGTSVLDGIRAASAFVDLSKGIRVGPVDAVALEGHSQGGHAVLATLAATDHAPELPIVVAVALAAPGAPGPLVEALANEDRWGGFVAMATLGWTHAYPSLGPPEDWLVDDTLIERLDEDCLLGLSGVIADPVDELLDADVVRAYADGDFDRIGLTAVLAQEDLGAIQSTVPLTVFHGTDDDLLPIGLTEALVDRMRAAGTPATFRRVEGGDHLLLPHAARDEVLEVLQHALPAW